MYRDRELTRAFTERALSAGYDALILTTDNQVLGNRERDVRNGFTIPPRFTAGSALGMLGRAPWLWRMRGRRGLTFANYVGTSGDNDIASLAAKMSSLLDPGASWTDVAWLRALWPGPLLLKGVLHPDEARRAVAEGIDGIIVSNHGGRQLDGAPGTIDALPAIVAAVGGRIPILLDGGVRRGADVVKALALGGDRLPDRSPASLGAGRRRRGRRRCRARPLPPRDRPRDGAGRLGRLAAITADALGGRAWLAPAAEWLHPEKWGTDPRP